MTNYSKDIFSSLLLDNVCRLNNIFLTDDVDKQVYIFNEVFIHCLDMCAPTETKVVKRPPTPWMNDDLRNAIKDRNEAQSRLKDDRQNSFLQQEYKIKKNLVKTMISNTKSEYYQNEIINCKGKISSTWQTIEEMIPCQKNKSNTYAFDNLKDKVEEFSHFFCGETTYNRSQELLGTYSDSTIHHNDSDSDSSLLF